MSRRKSSGTRRQLSVDTNTKLGMTLGKGASGNIVRTVSGGGACAKNGVQTGWTLLKVNGTPVSSSNASDSLKSAVRKGGKLLLEFAIPEIDGGGRKEKLMFDRKKKHGLTLESNSNIVKSVARRGAASKLGVQKGWIVICVDGTDVDGSNTRSVLKKAGKGRGKYMIIFATGKSTAKNKMIMSLQISPRAASSKECKETEGKVQEAEQKAKEEVEMKEKEAEQRAKEEAEQRAKEEAEQKEKEEAELRAKEEEERKVKEDAELKAKEEERKVQEEAEKRAQEEAELKVKEEAEQKAKEEAERAARAEAERLEREEAERKAAEEDQQTTMVEAELTPHESDEQKLADEVVSKEDATEEVAPANVHQEEDTLIGDEQKDAPEPEADVTSMSEVNPLQPKAEPESEIKAEGDKPASVEAAVDAFPETSKAATVINQIDSTKVEEEKKEIEASGAEVPKSGAVSEEAEKLTDCELIKEEVKESTVEAVVEAEVKQNSEAEPEADPVPVASGNDSINVGDREYVKEQLNVEEQGKVDNEAVDAIEESTSNEVQVNVVVEGTEKAQPNDEQQENTTDIEQKSKDDSTEVIPADANVDSETKEEAREDVFQEEEIAKADELQANVVVEETENTKLNDEQQVTKEEQEITADNEQKSKDENTEVIPADANFDCETKEEAREDVLQVEEIVKADVPEQETENAKCEKSADALVGKTLDSKYTEDHGTVQEVEDGKSCSVEEVENKSPEKLEADHVILDKTVSDDQSEKQNQQLKEGSAADVSVS